jgi:hypothetical protein
MSTQPTKFSIEELQARRQAESKAEDGQREEEDRLFEEEVRSRVLKSSSWNQKKPKPNWTRTGS